MVEPDLTFDEACAELRITRTTLYRYLAGNIVVGYKADDRPRTRWSFKRDDLKLVVKPSRHWRHAS
jgi:hypothetical protein